MLDDFDRLLPRAQAGEPEAFTAIYQDLVRPVAAYLRARGVLDVEDATSEVFISVFTGVARFTGEQAQFRSWVFTIAHRRAVDTWRRTGRRPIEAPYEPEDDERVSASAETEALDLLGGHRVLELLDHLTEDQREVLTLRVIADLTVDQVAAVMGKQAGAVKALQRRGLATLRDLLVSEGVTL